MCNESIIKFLDWFDKHITEGNLNRLKDEESGTKWFLNIAPNKPEGEQSWIKLTNEKLVYTYKKITDKTNNLNQPSNSTLNLKNFICK